MGFCYKQNSVIENSIQGFFTLADDMIKSDFSNAVSLLLLGSLSRGEGSWITADDGRPRLVSDIEFYAVRTEGALNETEFLRRLRELGDDCLSDFATGDFHIDISFISRNQLKNADRKLLVYDANAFGKIVAGPVIELQFPIITAATINRFDIREIASHRAYAVLTADITKEPEYRYILAKNTLDLMIILLVSYGLIESGFIRRFRALGDLDISDEYKRFFKYCLDIKLGGDVADEYEIESMLKLFIEINEFARGKLHITPANIRINRRKVARRLLGIAKRAAQVKTTALPKRHYLSLIRALTNRASADEKLNRRHYVLYGYPQVLHAGR